MQDFWVYFELGWQHILDLEGYDHILFVMVLCCSYFLKDWKKVIVLVTAFTLGHSLTLALSVFDVVRMNTAVIEFLIPVTIVVTALTNILMPSKGKQSNTVIYGYALFFGFIHGLGFSNYLRSLLGKEESILAPLFAFNVGLEIGQLIIVAVALLLSQVLISLFGVKRRDWTFFVSSAIFGIALVMCIERL